jgi:ribose transport system substrate-binding protein
MHRRYMGTARTRMLILAIAALTALVTACGSSVSTSSSPAATSSASAAATSAGASPGTSGAQQSEAAAAQQVVDQYDKPPTTIPQTTPLSAAPPKGKTFVWLQCLLPTCVEIGKGVDAAAAAVGWNVKTLSYDSGNPSTLVAAMKQALQYKPVGVGLSGLPQSEWSSVIPLYTAAHVAIIPSYIGANPTTSTVPVNLVGVDFAQLNAKLLANWIIADSGASAGVLNVEIPTFPFLQDFSQGVQSIVTQGCTACKVNDLALSLPDVTAGNTVQLIVAGLRRDPSAKYVVIPDAAYIDGLPSALKAAGLSGIKVLGENGDAQAESNMKTGVQPGAWTGTATAYSGWLDIDAMARVLEKATPTDPSDGGLPVQLLTQSSITTPSDTFDLPADYPAQFKKLWQVG